MSWVTRFVAWLKGIWTSNDVQTPDQTTTTPDVPKTFSTLNVTTNSLITLSTNVFTEYQGYTMMSSPGNEVQVTHVGCINLFQTDVYRFYLIPLEVEMDVGIFIEYHDTLNPKTAHTILYQTVDEVYPQTVDEWDWWLDEEEGALHGPSFVFNGEIHYERVWTNLMSMTETVHPDKSTRESEYSYPIQSSLYRRNISEEGAEPFYEFLLVSVEDGEKVAIYAGMDVTRGAIKVS